MIISHLIGGLGNQLFGFCAARRLSLFNDMELVIDDVSGFANDHVYRRHYQLDHFNISCRKATATERLEPFGRLRRKVLRKWSKRLPFEKRSYLSQESINYDSRLLHLRPVGKLHLEGYWQSELYFKDFEAKIREDLRIIPPTDDMNLEIAQQIASQTAVAVHVRFFDEPVATTIDPAYANNAPRSYYKCAVMEMERRIPSAHYFIFSDRPEDAKSLLSLDESRMTLIDHNKGDAMAYADLWLMSQCDHFIIANSTFSWWGAWIAKNRSKLVFAPGFEKREGKSCWGFDGLIPSEWVKF